MSAAMSASQPAESTDLLIAHLYDARQRTLALIDGLDAQQLIGPKLDIVNPLLWEIGHVAYFYEYWILQHLDGGSPLIDDADRLFDSIHIAHDDRWQLPLPTLAQTRDYMQRVHDAVIQRLKRGSPSEKSLYLTRYALFHEDMHTEAFTYTRRTLAYPAPVFRNGESRETPPAQPQPDGDCFIAGGQYRLGAAPGQGFCFDNEKWSHTVTVAPFAISRTATRYADFLPFVEADGYRNPAFWDEAGWQWLQRNPRQAPNGWKREPDGRWQVRFFDRWQPMPLEAAVIHINWHEAQAWCRWAGRRLPSEAEWELAASGTPDDINAGRLYPWGDQPPDPVRVNMDGYALGAIDANALPDGDSAFGCRQMLGNVWEWTADVFRPYPGFTPDMYADYSQPLFGNTRVLRGGGWATRSRLIRNTWRNYYGAERDDVFAGFRSCALSIESGKS